MRDEKIDIFDIDRLMIVDRLPVLHQPIISVELMDDVCHACARFFFLSLVVLLQ